MHTISSFLEDKVIFCNKLEKWDFSKLFVSALIFKSWNCLDVSKQNQTPVKYICCWQPMTHSKFSTELIVVGPSQSGSDGCLFKASFP